MVLGFVGVVAALGLGVAVWPVAARVDQRTNELTTAAIQHIDEAEPVLNELQRLSTQTATSVAAIGQAADRVAMGTVPEDPTLDAKIQEILRNLAPMLEQAESLGQMLKTVGVMMKSTAQLQSTLGGSSSDTQHLRVLSEKLIQASDVLHQVNGDLKSLQGGKAVPQALKVVELATLARQPLSQLVDGITDIRQQTLRLRAELEEVRRKVHFWSLAGPPIVDGLLLWMALGQLCLFGWGRRQLRRS